MARGYRTVIKIAKYATMLSTKNASHKEAKITEWESPAPT